MWHVWGEHWSLLFSWNSRIKPFDAIKTSIDRSIIEIIQRTSQWRANLSREIITLSYLRNEGEQQLTSAARLIFPYLHARRTQRTQQIPHHARLLQLLNTVRERDLQRERNTHVKSDHVRVQVVNENDVNKQNGDTLGHHVKLTFKMSRHWNVSCVTQWRVTARLKTALCVTMYYLQFSELLSLLLFLILLLIWEYVLHIQLKIK